MTSILNYAGENQDALDGRSVAELKGIQARLAELSTLRHGSLESSTGARVLLNKTTGRLGKAIYRARRVMEIAAAGSPGGAGLPKATTTSYRPPRIHAFAVGHRQVLEKLDGAPGAADALTELGAALGEFDAAFAAAKSEKFGLREQTKGLDAELATISGKLFAYRTMAAYNVPTDDRRDLRTRLKAVAPAKSHHAKAEDQVAPETTVAPTVTATLPAIPATVVPPSSEHPAMSANA